MVYVVAGLLGFFLGKWQMARHLTVPDYIILLFNMVTGVLLFYGMCFIFWLLYVKWKEVR